MAGKWLCIGVCLLASTVQTAHADTSRDEVATLLSNAEAAQARGDIAVALQGYLAAHRLQPGSATARHVGQAYAALGKWAKAHQYLREALAGTELDAASKAALDAELAAVSTHVVVVSVVANVAGGSVKLPSGATYVLPAVFATEPGDLALRVDAPGHRARTVAFAGLAAGTSHNVAAELEAQQGQVAFTGPSGTQVRIDDASSAVVCTIPCTHALPVGGYTVYFTPPKGKLPAQDFQLEDGATLTLDAAAAPVVEIDADLLGFSDDTVAAAKADIATSQARQAVLREKLESDSLDAAAAAILRRDLANEMTREAELRELINLPATTVTAASRETESIDDAPASVSVISRQELEAFAYPTIFESLRGVRGFAINNDSAYGNASVRGLGQANDYTNRLLLLSDGATLNENILYQPFIHYDGRTDLGDVERIEIVRGPASVLYGTGAVSGVVNLVMRGKDQPNNVHAQVSSYDDATARVRAGFTHKFNASSGMWASISAARSQGHEVQLAGTTVQNVDRFDGLSTAGKAWWKDFTAQWFFTDRNVRVPTGTYGSVLNNPRTFFRDQRFLAEIKYEPKLTAHADLMVRAHINTYQFWENAVYDELDSNGDATGATYDYQEKYRGIWGGLETRLRYALAKNIKLAIAGEVALHPEVSMVSGQYSVDGADYTQNFDIRAPYQVYSASGLLDWKFSPKVRFQGGVRVDYDLFAGNQNAASGDDVGDSSYVSVSPRGVLVVQPRPSETVKLIAGRGFRAPSVFEQYYNDGGVTQAPSTIVGQRLQPEHVNTLELEGTHRFGEGWAALASLYATLATGVIETAPVPDDVLAEHPDVTPGAFYLRNSQLRQTMLGADFELRREFRNGAMFSAQYGVLRGRYSAAPSGDPAFASRALPNAPTHFAAFKLIVPIIPNGLTGALRAAIEDHRRVDLATTEPSDRAIVADIVFSGPVKKLGVRYAVGMYNLLNWQYREPASGYADATMPQQGRTFMVSLTATR